MKIELINSMGDDLTVVNSARVSFDKESEWENITPAGPINHLLTEKDTVHPLYYYNERDCSHLCCPTKV